MIEQDKYSEPLESIFAHGEFSAFKDFLKTKDKQVDSGLRVEDVSKGGGRVGKVYRVLDYAVKVAKEYALRADIKREGAIYQRLKDIPHIVKLQSAPENSSYLVLDFVKGTTPDKLFAEKDIDSKVARQQRITVLKTLLTTLSEAMQRGLFINDIDLTSNSIVSEHQKEITTTVIDVGDAIDVKEVEQKLKELLVSLLRNVQTEKASLDRLQKDQSEKKIALRDAIKSIPADLRQRSDILTIINNIRDESLKQTALHFLNTPPETKAAPKSEGSPITRALKSFLLISDEAPTPSYFSTTSLHDKVSKLNLVRTTDIKTTQESVSQLENLIKKLEAVLKNVAEKPQESVTYIRDFFEDTNETIPNPSLSDTKLEIRLKYLQRLTEFTEDIAKLALELLAKDFQIETFDHVQESSSVEQNLKLPHELVEVIKKGLSRTEKDPSKLIQLILSNLSADQVKSYIEAGNDIEFFQVTDAIGELKAQRGKRYQSANTYFYDAIETKTEMTVEEEEKLVRETLEMLIGQKPLPKTYEALRHALSNTGMWFSSTEQVINTLAPLLTSSTENKPGRLIQKIKELFSSINLSGFSTSGEGSHLYFSFKTKEGFDAASGDWKRLAS